MARSGKTPGRDSSDKPMDDPLKESAGAPARTDLDDAIDDLIRHLADQANVREAEALEAVVEGEVIVPRRRRRLDDHRIMLLLGVTAILASIAALLD